MTEIGVVLNRRRLSVIGRLSAVQNVTMLPLQAAASLANRFTPAILKSVICLVLVSQSGLAAWGQTPAAPTSGVADKQIDVTERYRKLEELLLRLADLEADENPERAALLRRAAKQSRDTFVLEKMQEAGTSLKAQQFAKAIENQTNARDGVNRLLELLLSEDRPQRIRDEKKRIAEVIKELKLVERLQRSTRARTENGADLEEISEEQKQISDRSEKVEQQLSEDDPASEKQSPGTESGKSQSGEESNPSSGKSDQPSGESQPKSDPSGDKPEGDKPEGDKPEGDKSEGDQPEGDQPEGDKPQENESQSPGEPADAPEQQPNGEQQPKGELQPAGESQSSPSQSGESSESSGSQSQSQPQSQEQQAQSQLDEAIKKMRQAEKELEQAKRGEAVEQQKQAEENLRTAIDRLERILRQLREEEMQRELARLESRIRKMAQMQGKVLDDTKLLVAIPETQRDRQVDLKSGNLAFEEKKIVLEADRAMLLLREEGSSVAFPEVMVQVRADMQRVAERLSATKLDTVTTGIQEDILAALEEMIAALQQAQRDLEKQKQQSEQGQPQQGQEPGEQPLVQQIAELKLIRTMETRIKTTTQRYAELLAGSPAGNSDVVQLLQELAQRQGKLYQVTRDLVVKRNQ